MGVNTDYRLMQVESIAECYKGSILQYFRPSLTYPLSFIPLFCLFLSGHFTQVLLYLDHLYVYQKEKWEWYGTFSDIKNFYLISAG